MTVSLLIRLGAAWTFFSLVASLALGHVLSALESVPLPVR